MPTKPTGRPRGRPKGVKNVPTVAQFVVESLAEPLLPPVAAQRRGRPFSHWATLPAEDRSTHFKTLAFRKKTHRGGKPHGVPRCMTVAQYEAHQSTQQSVVARVLKKMGEKGQLPDDPRAIEALRVAMTVLRGPQAAKDKIGAARLILDFTQAKPATHTARTVKTAEDFLDDLAADALSTHPLQE